MSIHLLKLNKIAGSMSALRKVAISPNKSFRPCAANAGGSAALVLTVFGADNSARTYAISKPFLVLWASLLVLCCTCMLSQQCYIRSYTIHFDKQMLEGTMPCLARHWQHQEMAVSILRKTASGCMAMAINEQLYFAYLLH